MAADTMEALGIPRGCYVVKINNRKVLDAAMEAIGLHGQKHIGTRLTVLRAIDKLDRFSEIDVQLLLTSGRKDPSGDFTKGAGLTDEHAQRILSRLRRSGDTNEDVLDGIRGSAGENATHQAGIDELEAISNLVSAAGYDESRIRIDPSVVRGLEYYTGPVFEVDLTFPTDGKDGSPRFGSVGGGGRYDGLISRFRNEPVPATGFSIGVSRLLAALDFIGKVDLKTERGPVVVTVFDRDRIADYQAMVAKLRNAGIRAELYLGPGKFGPQMKYADRRNSPCVVIQGSDEKARGEVTIKDLIVGAELAILEKGRDAHLQKQAQAQRSVPEDELVEAVREVLARHAIS
jgi:histidyl-tRNA synthetase